MNFIARVKQSSRELILFAAASLALGMAFSMVDSTFNNFINEKFPLTGFQRSFMEFPRELPGFLVVFVSAALWFLCSRRLSAFAMILSAAGALAMGFLSSSYALVALWFFIYSMGQHIFMPISPAIGMELAREGQDGRRLGQISAIRNFATIMGSFLVFVGFKYLGLTFQGTYTIAAVCLAIAFVLLYSMKPEQVNEKRGYLKLHKEYRLYYILNIISGARKQIFLTFAPWVLVNVMGEPTEIMATLYTIGGVIGIGFQPLLGWAVDKLGERFVLASEAVVLIFVCLGYGFAKFIFSADVAFYVICICFLLDQMIFSVSMARATYIKKIAKQPDHIQPALTAALTMDHVFSIATALIGGVIWNAFGFQYVFLLGVGIAIVNFFAALQVRVPVKATS
jgi:predicted MFS family arabinose efflux permease